MIATEGAVHEGEAIFGCLEEERVVVAAQATVECGKSLRSQFFDGMLSWINVTLLYMSVTVQSPHVDDGMAHDDFGETET